MPLDDTTESHITDLLGTRVMHVLCSGVPEIRQVVTHPRIALNDIAIAFGAGSTIDGTPDSALQVIDNLGVSIDIILRNKHLPLPYRENVMLFYYGCVLSELVREENMNKSIGNMLHK